MPLTDEDVREILRIIDESRLDELRIETEGFSLYVSKGAPAEAPPGPAPAQRPAASPAPAAPPAPEAAPGPAAPEAPDEAAKSDGLLTIEAPMLGTFYRAEAPGKDPFVDVGARVEPDTIVCIIEVMKMMNSVPAGVSGTIVEICPDNAQLVQFGEPLFRVRP
jgi:acetyl-CoA carboxylase biotin carboxyl carrier protein